MKTLYLLRHAKSAWDDPTLPDHDRPLAPRGKRAAATMAKYLAERKGGPPAPDMVLCSSARRAQDTLAAVAGAWPTPVPVSVEPGLYLCGEAALLDRLRALPDRVRSVMLVGHNPDFHHLALGLCVRGPAESLASLRAKLPTGSFLAIGLPDGPWTDLAWATGDLLEFTPPRSLD